MAEGLAMNRCLEADEERRIWWWVGVLAEERKMRTRYTTVGGPPVEWRVGAEAQDGRMVEGSCLSGVAAVIGRDT